MEHSAGLDVSVKETSVCIVDDTGKIVREVKVASEPDALLAVLTNPAYRFKRIGLEAGPTGRHSAAPWAVAGNSLAEDGIALRRQGDLGLKNNALMVLVSILDAIARVSRIVVTRGYQAADLIIAGSRKPKCQPSKLDGLTDHEFVRHGCLLNLDNEVADAWTAMLRLCVAKRQTCSRLSASSHAGMQGSEKREFRSHELALAGRA
jgi:hypothetical protein